MFGMDERRCIPPHVVLDLGNAGLLGLQAPRAAGGLELTHIDALRVVEQLGALDTTLALFVGVHNVLGLRPILKYGHPVRRTQVLDRLASGRALAAFALTEAGAGSNPRAMQAVATPLPGSRWRLSGTKWWSGNAGWAESINVFVRMPGVMTGDSTTAFSLRRGTPGLRIGAESMTMGVRGMVQNVVHLDDVVATEEDLLGNIGQGMEIAQDAMMFARLGIAAIAGGALMRCIQMMHSYAVNRRVSAGPLIDQPLIQEWMAEAIESTEVVQQLVARVADGLDRSEEVPVELFVVAKTSAPELLWCSIDRCVQLLGGRGYIETNPAAHVFRDARLLRIFEGPTEALNVFLGVRFITGVADIGAMARVLHRQEINSMLDDLRRRIEECGVSKPTLLRQAADIVGECVTDTVLVALSGSQGVDTHGWMAKRLEASVRRLTTRLRNPVTPASVAEALRRYEAAIGPSRVGHLGP